MGNASRELLGRGWTVTRPNSESGVAAAIEFVLDGKELDVVAT
jgi:hydroxymethylpyrimidine pyrophosphatase-like HAD family hydrolase